MATKERILQALHKAVDYFNESGDPSGAVVKAARDESFNLDQTARLLEMFNTARTIHHYKTASDRTATFELADPCVVIPDYYAPEAAKTAARLPATYSDYDEVCPDYRRSMVLGKGAHHLHPDEVFESRSGLDMNRQIASISSSLRAQRELAETAACAGRMAMDKAADISRRVAADLLATGGYACSVFYATRPDELEHLAPHMPAGIKAASALVVDDSIVRVHDKALAERRELVKEAGAAFELAAGIMDDAAAFIDDIACIDKEAESEPGCADMLKLSTITTKTTAKSTHPSPVAGLFSFFDKDKDGKPKKVPGSDVEKTVEVSREPVTHIVGDYLQERKRDIVTTGLDSMIGVRKIEQENKDLSETMHNFRRKMLLEDLIVNDPVLAEEDPDTVINAYRNLMDLAPEVSLNREVVRAILRQSVHSSAISPYDAKSFVDLEEALKSVRGTMPPRETVQTQKDKPGASRR